ncbi:MAG TPA: cyclodeaminase/cyclohydrolase family protein [Gaiellaceae bacterium]|nr:cyclodeaminase/cyclohydrolase family protein [Gaiellaceae bacterium]
MEATQLGERRLEELLDAIAEDTLVPASGSVAGVVVAMAAALTAMAARRSSGTWAQAGGAVAQAEALRRRATPLAQEDAEAYLEAVARLEQRASGRDAELGRALARAAEVPLLIAQVAADVAALAKEVAESGDPAVRGDATGAALLAQAAARAAAHLVEINLAAGPGDLRVLSANSLAAAASAWADAALAAAH